MHRARSMLSTKIYILHGLPFSSQYTTGKASTIQKCAKCHNNDIELKYRLISAMNVDFRDYCLNRMSLTSIRPTRTGTGFGEGGGGGGALYSSCYQICRKKYGADQSGTIYSPTKCLRIDAGSSDAIVSQSSAHTTSQMEESCIFCPYASKKFAKQTVTEKVLSDIK